MGDRAGWGLLPPKEVREQKEREWAASMEEAHQIAEQVEALRMRLPQAEQGQA